MMDHFRANATRRSKAPLRVLDIGIGTGLSANPFLANFDCHVTGIDFSEDMLSQCHKRFRKTSDRLNLLHADAMDTQSYSGFENDSFDLVTSAGLFEFVPPDKAPIIFKQAHRVLKKGGVFAMTFETTRETFLRVPEYLNRYDREDILRIAEKFQDLTTEPYRFEAYSTDFAKVTFGQFIGRKPA
jgi:ubiquinone/menaquinone biosynthesis C-methylase UbiE